MYNAASFQMMEERRQDTRKRIDAIARELPRDGSHSVGVMLIGGGSLTGDWIDTNQTLGRIFSSGDDVRVSEFCLEDVVSVFHGGDVFTSDLIAPTMLDYEIDETIISRAGAMILKRGGSRDAEGIPGLMGTRDALALTGNREAARNDQKKTIAGLIPLIGAAAYGEFLQQPARDQIMRLRDRGVFGDADMAAIATGDFPADVATDDLGAAIPAMDDQDKEVLRRVLAPSGNLDLSFSREFLLKDLPKGVRDLFVGIAVIDCVRAEATRGYTPYDQRGRLNYHVDDQLMAMIGR